MLMRMIFTGIVISAGFLQSARAEEKSTTSIVPEPSCACVAQGRRWAQGEEACIAGVRMVCGMNQNVTTWNSLGQSCQVSSLLRLRYNFHPHVIGMC